MGWGEAETRKPDPQGSTLSAGGCPQSTFNQEIHMFKNRIFTAFAFTGLLGLTACGGAETDTQVIEEPAPFEEPAPMAEPMTEPMTDPMMTDTAAMPMTDTAAMPMPDTAGM